MHVIVGDVITFNVRVQFSDLAPYVLLFEGDSLENNFGYSDDAKFTEKQRAALTVVTALFF